MDHPVNRLRGCLYGLAVGDALGAAVEFCPPGSFPAVTGYRTGGPHGLAAGEWTDDTAMALALADSIAGVGWDLNDQAKRYLAWYGTSRYSVNDRCFDIGIQTSQALRRFEQDRDAKSSAPASELASGNGSIMRLAPVVVPYGRSYPENVELLLDRAEESSIPTHASPICRSACRYLALILAALASGVPRDEVLSPAWSMLQRLGPHHPAVQPIVEGSFRARQPPAIRGGGYVVESLEPALWAFHAASGFGEAVLRAVNLGDDADTTGAVCGQLAGACWGESGIPEEWRAGFARRLIIETALQGLLQAAERRPGSGGSAPPNPHEAPEPREAGSHLALPPRSYWVAPGTLLAGCYPGALDPVERDAKLGRLLDSGVRTFVNLTEPGESHLGRRLAHYEEAALRLAAARGLPVRCLRFPVPDGNVPSAEGMQEILLAIDSALQRGPVHLHCLGGIGRTGTVAACWLLTHGHTTAEDVFARLTQLRVTDHERGQYAAPEPGVQRRFVLDWARRLNG